MNHVRDRNPKAKKYVTNAVLLPLIRRDKAAGKLSNELAACLYQIADKYSHSNSFKWYSFREELVAEAVLSLMKTWDRFDEDKMEVPNPFSFYTTCCYRSFLKVLKQEREQRDIRDELLLDAGMSPSMGYEGDSDMAFGADK